MTDRLPPRVAAEVKRILDRAAQRLLNEGYRRGPDGALIKPETPSERNHTMKDGTYMGNRFTTQLNGQTVTVLVKGAEQSINSKHRGKWVCLNEATGRRLHRTSRQLHPLESRSPSS